MNPKMTVEAKAPRNPSHVFLGESLIRRVRPKKNPVREEVEGVCVWREGGRWSVCVCGGRGEGGVCVCVWREGGRWSVWVYGGMCCYIRNRIIHNTLLGNTSSNECPWSSQWRTKKVEGREGGKLCLTKEVGCNVITDDHGDREEAPEESLKNILSDKVGL